MKIKTINKVITNKVNEWLESIEDKKLKYEIKDNIIVTGGCIASMLLKEKVNDYDIYFRDLKTTYNVAKYYEKIYELPEDTVRLCVSSEDLKDGWINLDLGYTDRILNGDLNIDIADVGNLKDKEIRVRFFIESNGVAGEPEKIPEQYDTYENSLLEGIEALNELEDAVEEHGKYKPTFITDNAITLNGDIQLVIRFYGEPDKIHENYDFVHCTNYWDSKTKQVHTNIKALEAILARELVYVGSRYPLASIFRMRKFIKRDWNINVGQILKACMQLNDFDLSNPYVLTDQCTGVDVHYLKNLVGDIVAEMESRRKNNEPISIDKGYAMTVIEKIFG